MPKGIISKPVLQIFMNFGKIFRSIAQFSIPNMSEIHSVFTKGIYICFEK